MQEEGTPNCNTRIVIHGTWYFQAHKLPNCISLRMILTVTSYTHVYGKLREFWNLLGLKSED